MLNCALEIGGAYPIETEIKRIDEAVIRCHADGHSAVAEYRTAEELLEPCGPGSVFSIPRAALRLHGLPVQGQPLKETLAELGGGIEIRCQVRLPIGSGLGTSSILAATVIRALAVMSGRELDDHALSQAVMQLEQRMTTGGGWQDQAGGIFPGAKLLITGPGLRQRIRVQPVIWTESRQAEFNEHLVLYNTGIQRVAKDLLRQVVSRYLARETATIQVLHSIKTLAVEMSYAMAEGDWKHLGELLDRHWQLNQILDPHTTNAPINAILDRARPYIYGAKLAGAGGGGFQRALHPLRNHLVVAHLDDLAVGLAHDARNVRNLSRRGWRLLRRLLPSARRGQHGRRVRRPVLRKLIAAQASRPSSGHDQQAGCHGRGLQAGKTVDHSLAEPFIPAHRRQCVQRFFQFQARTRYQIGRRLRHRVRIGQNLERQNLIALRLAFWARGQVPVQLMDMFIRQLLISRRHNPLVCKFAIHLYVLPASEKSCFAP